MIANLKSELRTHLKLVEHNPWLYIKLLIHSNKMHKVSIYINTQTSHRI